MSKSEILTFAFSASICSIKNSWAALHKSLKDLLVLTGTLSLALGLIGKVVFEGISARLRGYLGIVSLSVMKVGVAPSMPVNLGSEESEVLNGAGLGSITLFFLNSSTPSAQVKIFSAMVGEEVKCLKDNVL